MKEFLFKGKRLDNDEWVYGLLLETPLQEYCEHGSNLYIVRGYAEHDEDGWHFLSYLVDEETVGQYTGLIDKNGKKIFEGDVVNCISSDIVGNPKISKILVENMTDYNTMVYLNISNELELIGSIHDNPELLNI